MSILDDMNIPVGFGMALAQDLNALNAFSALDAPARANVIARSRSARSKSEMQRLVRELSGGN